jgi:rfaE bifunctional protein kinase chain/domain
VGDDHAADSLRAALEGLGVDVSGLVVDATRPTTVKLRVMASSGLRFPQQLARLDTLSRQPISAEVEAQVLAQAEALLKRKRHKPHALLLSDYQTGLLTPTLVSALRERGTAAKLLLTADSQGHFEKYAGFGVVKCNADEAREYLRRDLHSADEFAAAAAELRRALNLTRAMVITRGNAGATVATPEAVTHHPAPAVSDVYDTVGAGDTTIAVLTLAVSAGASVGEAAQLANTASGLVIRKVGNYAPKPDELAWAFEHWQTT